MKKPTKSSVTLAGLLLILGLLIIKQQNNQIAQYIPSLISWKGGHQQFAKKMHMYTPYYIKNVFEEADKVAIFYDLCIEPDNNGGIKLVSYNCNQTKTHNITVKAGFHVPEQEDQWTIYTTTQARPKTGLDFNTAFFVTGTCEGNFHHFWLDSTWGLYGAMKKTGMLGSKIPSQLYYHEDLWNQGQKFGCHNPARYQDFLFALPVRKEHVFYKDATLHSCYDNAIFGYYSKGYSNDEMREYFTKAFNISRCPSHNKTRVTIINRKTRVIKNAEELKEAAIKAGFITKIVYLSDLSVREQFQIMQCTDILVGVQGAGLRWIDYLPKNASLLELLWKHWRTHYSYRAQHQKKKVLTFDAYRVELNLTAYFDIFKNRQVNVTKEMISEYETKGPRSVTDNHWKYANGFFDANQFVTHLKNLIP